MPDINDKANWEMGWNYRNGEPAEILTNKRNDADYTVVTLAKCGLVSIHYADGRHQNNPERDLIPRPAKKVLELWINTYGDAVPRLHVTRELADRYINPSRTACVHVVQEFEEGEGL